MKTGITERIYMCSLCLKEETLFLDVYRCKDVATYSKNRDCVICEGPFQTQPVRRISSLL